MCKENSLEHKLPRVALIAAMTRDRVIGSQAKLPWDLPEELQLFKRLTLGGTVMMGRKTFESIGKALPGRQNIVLSRHLQEREGVEIFPSFIEGLAAADKHGKQVFVIGGAGVYQKSLPITSEMHISWIEERYQGDVYFPDFDLNEWRVAEETNYPGFTYTHYIRK